MLESIKRYSLLFVLFCLSITLVLCCMVSPAYADDYLFPAEKESPPDRGLTAEEHDRDAPP